MGKLSDSLKKKAKKELQPSIDGLKESFNDLACTLFVTERQNCDNQFFSDITQKNEYAYYLRMLHKYDYYIVSEKDTYHIYDTEQNLKYLISGHSNLLLESLNIYQEEKEQIGRIKMNILPYFSLLELESHVRCSKIQYKDEESFTIRISKDFGTWKYHIKRKHWQITYSKKQNAYSIFYKKEKIGYIYVPTNTEKHYAESWIIGYNNKDMEQNIVIIATCIRNMLRA